MLNKVMKYELRSNGRILLPLFGLTLAISAVVRIIIELLPYLWEPVAQALRGIVFTMGVLMLVAVVTIATIIIVVRFYQSMATKEAYITFTLPVSANTHILGKTIVGTLYSVVALLVALVSGWIFMPRFFKMALNTGEAVVGGIPPAIKALFTPDVIGVGILLFVVLTVLSCVGSLTQYYASIAIGVSFGKSRLLASVVSYFVLINIEGALGVLIMLPLMNIFLKAKGGFDGIDYILKGTDVVAQFALMKEYILYISIISIVMSIAFIVLQYIIAQQIFTKKLNLE